MSSMTKPISIWIAWILLVAAGLFSVHRDPALAQTTTVDSFASMGREDFGQWMSFYYESKRPEVMPAAIARASEIGIFSGDALPPMVGFLAGYFSDNPSRIDATLGEAKSLPSRAYQAVLTAAVLGAEPGSTQQNALFDQLDADGQWLIKAFIASGVHAKNDVKTSSATALDFLWGVFFATGDTKSVLPIVATIGMPKKAATQEDLMVLAVHKAAAWSLDSNAHQHPEIMQLCKKEMGLQPPEIAKELRKIVEGS
jgi:hypothetical protein